MKQLHLIIAVLLFSVVSNGQVTFQKTFDFSIGSDVVQTTDGGYAIAGIFSDILVGSGMVLIKTDLNGDTLWTKTFGAIGDNAARSIQQTNDGGYIMCGYSLSFGHEIFVIKTDSTGSLEWTKTYGGPGLHEGECAMQVGDQGYIISGESTLNGQAYIIKTTSTGDTLWTRHGGGTGSIARAYSVQPTFDGGYIVGGYAEVTITNKGFYLLKLNSAGDTLWTRTYGGNVGEEGRCVRQTADSGFIITGKADTSGTGENDIFVIKADSLGNMEWAKTYGTVENESAFTVDICSDGGFIIAGQTVSDANGSLDAYLLKLSSSGNLMWAKSYGGNDNESFRCARQSAEGGFIATGYKGSNLYMVKTDALGNSGCDEGTPFTQEGTPTVNVDVGFNLVSTGGTVSIPSPDLGSGCNVAILCSSGVNDILESEKHFSVYPNPSHRIINIEVRNEIKNANLEIMDALGQVKLKKSFESLSKFALDLDNFSSGIYLVRLIGVDKHYARKIIVQ